MGSGDTVQPAGTTVTATLLTLAVEQPRFATFQSSSTFVLDAEIATGDTETTYSSMFVGLGERESAVGDVIVLPPLVAEAKPVV